ncbi:MAG: ABC transporter permease [Vicinamibacterales bacterium]
MPLLLQIAIDVGIAAGSYWLASQARFVDSPATVSGTGAGGAGAIVVAVQMASLAAAGIYSSSLRTLWPRLLLGALLGTTVGALVATSALPGIELSRRSLVVHALLLVFGAFAWRGGVVLAAWMPRSRADDGPEMEDRADRVSRARHALFGIVSHRQLLENLLRRDLKLKYRGSAFGFVWSLLNPLLMLVVYTVAFRYILGMAEPGFVFRVLIGLLAWGFFANSLGMSTGAIVDNRGFIKSVFFPRTILPAATVLFNLSQFLLNLVVFVPLMLLIFGVRPTLAMLALPAIVALHFAFTLGAALVVATATAFYRDVRHLLEVVLNVLFWTTPIIYSYRQLPPNVTGAIMLSPVSPFIVAYQRVLVYGEWPDLGVSVIAVAYAAVSLISGFLLFVSVEERFAEQV